MSGGTTDRFTGGPLDGPYRNASIVHDVACVSMTDPWDDVHFMFYEACRCGGVPEMGLSSEKLKPQITMLGDAFPTARSV